MKRGFMKLLNVNNNIQFSAYNRLLSEDIGRLPNLAPNKSDSFIKQDRVTPNKNSHKWRNIFTVATFGLTALCIAYRNNLFNPIKREATAIIKNDELKNKLLSFIKGKVNDEYYMISTKKYLTKLTTDKNIAQDIISQSKEVLADNNQFDKLLKKVSETLEKNDTNDGLEKGYVVTLLDKLKQKIERYLTQNKQNNLPYKNQETKIIADLFDAKNGKTSIIQDMYEDVIIERSQSTIDNFLNDLIDAKQYGY